MIRVAQKTRRTSFRVWKNGDLITATNKGDDGFERETKVDSLIPLDRVFAVDTESAFKNGQFITDLIPIAWSDGTTLLNEADSKDRIVERFLREVLTRYGVSADAPSRTKQRRRRSRAGDEPGGETNKKRDGRRSFVPLAVSVWFNLPYDITRLFSDAPEIRAIHAGVDSWNMTLGNGLSIEWLRYIDKSAPQFHWMIRDEDRRLVCNLVGIDLTGYWKCSLQDASKSLGGEGKDDIEALVPNVHERAFETFSEFEQEARKSYAVKDVEETAFVYRRTVEELIKIDSRIINKKGLIPPSAPSCAARILFERAFDAHPTMNRWDKPPAWVDQLGCDGYYGGRAFGARPAVYPVGGFRILDLKSAYPAIMVQLPDPVTAKYVNVTPTNTFDVNKFKGKFGVLVISGECTDARYPAFRAHDQETTKLRYVAGAFYKRAVTIPEIMIGIARGSLRVDKIHSGVIVEGSSEKSFLRAAVLELYALKEREGKSPLGKLAKLLMNSAYGKLIEIVMKELRTNSSLPVPRFTNHVEEISHSIIRLDIEPGAPAAELFFSTDEDEAKSLRVIYESRALGAGNKVITYTEVLATVHKFEGGVTMRDFVRGARSYTTGRYFLPIFAAQITGLVSAELGSMAACVNAYCGDTDSVHFLCEGDPLEHPGIDKHFEIMKRAGYAAPRAGAGYEGTDLAPGCTLGRWESDSASPSTESVIVRPKVYSHRFINPDGSVEYKQAFHGFARYTCPEAEAARKDASIPLDERGARAKDLRAAAIHEDMKRLIAGEKVDYVTRPAPRKGRTAAITGELAGEFITRKVTVVNPPVFGAFVDPRDGWIRWLAEIDLLRLSAAAE